MLLGRTGDTRGYLRDVTVVHAAVPTGATNKLQAGRCGGPSAQSLEPDVCFRCCSRVCVFSGLGEQSPKRKTAT